MPVLPYGRYVALGSQAFDLATALFQRLRRDRAWDSGI